MKKHLDSILQTRKFLLELIKDLSAEQINKVPAGFNNNIVWNLGHMIAAQQSVCYRRAGLPLIVEDSFFTSYKPDSRPDGYVGPLEIDRIKALLISTLDQFEADYEKHIFSNYPAWSTRYGLQISGIDEAISFLPWHEGLHSGYIMALKRLV
ncbi:MAG TPA: DinB family protein [Flavisolibacter sp.]|jgi:hypothetical protein|nr:DinB family protein [Flavisolibacter sp.]